MSLERIRASGAGCLQTPQSHGRADHQSGREHGLISRMQHQVWTMGRICYRITVYSCLGMILFWVGIGATFFVVPTGLFVLFVVLPAASATTFVMAMLEFFRGDRSSRRLDLEAAVQHQSDEARRTGFVKGVEAEKEVLPYKPLGHQEQVVQEVTMPRHQATYMTSPYQIQLPYSKWQDMDKALKGARVPTTNVVGLSAVPVEARVHGQELAFKHVQEGVHGEYPPAVPPVEEKLQAQEVEQYFPKEKGAAEMGKESSMQVYTAREDKAKEPATVVTEEELTGGKMPAQRTSLADRLLGTPSRKNIQNPVHTSEEIETHEPCEVKEGKGGYEQTSTWSGDLGAESLSYEPEVKPEGKKLSEMLLGKPKNMIPSPAHSGELTGHRAQVLHLSPAGSFASNKGSFIPASGEFSVSSGDVSGYYNTAQGVPNNVEEFSHGTQSVSSEGNAAEESSKTEEPEIHSAQPVDTAEEKNGILPIEHAGVPTSPGSR